MTSPPSNWWPTPVRPSSWFSDEQLAQSRRYHRPLLWVAVLRTVAQLGFVAVAHVRAQQLQSDWAFIEIGLWLALAWWLPAVFADAWFEYRHQPTFGHQPLPIGQFVLAGAMVVATLAVLLIGLGGVLYFVLIDLTSWWSVLLGLMVGFEVAGRGRSDRSLQRAAGPLKALPEPIQMECDEIAEVAGVASVEFHTTEASPSTEDPDPTALQPTESCATNAPPSALTGLNAFSARSGKESHIVISADLCRAEQALRRHVVAHELAHLRLGHHSINRIASVVAIVSAFGCLGLFVRWGQPFALLGVSDADQPEGMVVATVLAVVLMFVFEPLLAWLGRAHERQADHMASVVVGGQPVPLLRRLHANDKSDLDPSWLSRLLSPHPTPAERLYRASLVPSTGLPS